MPSVGRFRLRSCSMINKYSMLLDIHTHHLPENPWAAIQSCSPEEFSFENRGYYSVGFHPWHLSPDGIENWELLTHLVSYPQVLAIGECGLDKLTKTDWELQKVAFRRQAQLAATVRKPLIIHAVRANEEVIFLKKEFSLDIPWIIHGFRGKKELAQQLIAQGFYLSFGENYHPETLRIVPIERLFLETDESLVSILNLYERAADCLSLSTNELIESVQSNISQLFFKM